MMLVHQPAASGSESKLPSETPTPFADFMRRLDAMTSVHMASMLGRAEWFGFPVEEAVASGLWPVLLRVAERRSQRMTTEHEAVDKVAPMVDRLLNIGLVLAYGDDMAKAAEDFLTVVADGAQEALGAVPSRETTPADGLWRESAARFFAALLKRTLEHGEEIVRLTRQVSHQNTASKNRGIYYLTGAVVEDRSGPENSVCLMSCDLAIADYKSSPRLLISSAVHSVSRMREQLEGIRLLRLLPVHLRRLPPDMVVTESYIEFSWLKAQALLAVLGLSDELEYLTLDEYGEACGRLAALDDARWTDLLFQRLSRRGMKASSEDWDKIRTLFLSEVFRELRAVSELRVSANVQLSCYVYIPLGGLEKTARNVDLSKQVEAEDLHFKRGEAVSAMGEQSIWTRLGPEDFGIHFENLLLHPHELVQGFSWIKPEYRKEAFEAFLRSGNRSDEAIAVLLASGAIEPALDLVFKYEEAFSPKLLGPYLPRLLDALVSGGLALKDLEAFAAVLATAKEANALAAPATRPNLATALHALVLDSGISSYRRGAIRRRFTPQEWTLLMLGGYMLMREPSFSSETDLVGVLPEEHELPWELMLRRTSDEDFLTRVLGVSAERLKAILAKNSEDGVFAWIYAGAPDLGERLARFREGRERYFRRHPPSVPSPSVKKSRKKS